MNAAHGGAIFSIIDYLTSVAAISKSRNNLVSVSTKINVAYFSPVMKDENVYFLSECVKSGKRMSFSECWVYDKNHELAFRGHQSHACLDENFFDMDLDFED